MPQYDELAHVADSIEIFKNGERVHRSLGDDVGANRGAQLTTHIVLRDKHGKIKDERWIHNTVTTPGKNMIADRLLASPTLGVPTHMGIGTGTGGTTDLNTPLDRNALTSKLRSNAVVTMVGDWAAGDGTGAITEAGVFDASSSGNMHLYQSFSVINKGAADTLSISWTLTIS